MNTRIYVIHNGAGQPRMVRAASAVQAVKHCSKHLVARIPSVDDVVELMLAGVVVEDVVREEPAQP